jgi:hypothetical protein
MKYGMFPSILEETRSSQGRIKSRGTTNSPWDLSYLGGPVVTSATNWNIFTNCAASCWGSNNLTPNDVLSDLNLSSLIQINNQYLNENAAGQFSVAALTTTGYPFPNHTADTRDINSILLAAVKATKAAGYNNIYHLFLPPGIDVCVSAKVCYSPDNPKTFVFCAFHGSVDFSPTVHVLFSVEPYQFVPGCVLPQETRVIDATATALSHEFTEAITDPDLDAWFNLLTGNEIGDLCFAFLFPTVLNHHEYVVQEEYSNLIHSCSFTEDGS